MEVRERIIQEGKEIVQWFKKRDVKIVSAILFGSAVRGTREPEDLDMLVVVDEPDVEVDKLCADFHEIDLALTRKFGLYPELTILKKDSIGEGNPLFYYSIVRDGILLSGDKDLFIKALLKAEGREGLERACGLERAYGFLKHAEKDLKEAKDVVDLQLAAEGAYRACVEAVYALLRKHGMPIPSNHREEREKLQTLDELYPNVDLSATYSVLFEHLHAQCFYHGECRRIKEWISKAKEFIHNIAKLI